MDILKEKEFNIYKTFIDEDDYVVICKKISEIIGNPIYVFDSSYTLLISSDDTNNKVYLERLNLNKTSVLFNGTNSLLLSGEMTRISNTDETFIIEANDLKYPIMVRRIHNGNNLLGFIGVSGQYKVFDEDDKKLLGIICKVASKDMSIRNYADNSRSFILQEIIDGRFSDQKEIERILKDFGLSSNRYRVIGIRSDDANFLCEKILEKYPSIIITTYRNDVVVVADDRDIDYKEVEKEINILNNDIKVKAAISDVYKLVYYLRDAYKQVDKLLRIGSSSNSESIFYRYEDYKMELLLSIIDRNILEKAIDDRIKEVLLYDKNGDTDYINDLNTYFLANRSINDAADLLYIHKNSMYYRLTKIQEKFNINLENEEDTFLVEASLKILNFLNNVIEE